jgi:hypothetical protein
MAVRIGVVMLYRLNAHRPAKKVESRQASKTPAHSAEIAVRTGHRSAGGRQIVGPLLTLRSVFLPSNARRCVFGKPQAASRDRATRFVGRWFGGGRRTRSSSGTRPAYQHSCQCATRGRSENTLNNHLRHHLCVIYLTETCWRQNNSIRISKVIFNSSGSQPARSAVHTQG